MVASRATDMANAPREAPRLGEQDEGDPIVGE